MNNYLIHYGVPRRSGRYKYGSGKNPRAYRKLSKKIDSLEDQKRDALLRSDRSLTARLNPSYYSRADRKIRKYENKYDKIRDKIRKTDSQKKREKLYDKHGDAVMKMTFARNDKIEKLTKKQQKLKAQMLDKSYSNIQKKDIQKGQKQLDRLLGR